MCKCIRCVMSCFHREVNPIRSVLLCKPEEAFQFVFAIEIERVKRRPQVRIYPEDRSVWIGCSALLTAGVPILREADSGGSGSIARDLQEVSGLTRDIGQTSSGLTVDTDGELRRCARLGDSIPPMVPLTAGSGGGRGRRATSSESGCCCWPALGPAEGWRALPFPLPFPVPEGREDELSAREGWREEDGRSRFWEAGRDMSDGAAVLLGHSCGTRGVLACRRG